MKHVFSVHSPITFLVAYATIKHLQLKVKDVIFLSATYKILINDYKVIPSFAESRNSTLFQKIRYFNVPKSFDNYFQAKDPIFVLGHPIDEKETPYQDLIEEGI